MSMAAGCKYFLVLRTLFFERFKVSETNDTQHHFCFWAYLRAVAPKRQHVTVEGRLQLRLLEQVVLHDLRQVQPQKKKRDWVLRRIYIYISTRFEPRPKPLHRSQRPVSLKANY